MPSNSRSTNWTLALGILSMIAWLSPIVGLLVSLVGIIIGARYQGPHSARVIVGVALASVGLSLTLVNGLAGAYMGVQKAISEQAAKEEQVKVAPPEV